MMWCFFFTLALCTQTTSRDERISLKDLHESLREYSGKEDLSFPAVLALPLSIDLLRLTLHPEPMAFGDVELLVNFDGLKYKKVLVREDSCTPDQLFQSICRALRDLGNQAAPEECSRPWSRDGVQAVIDRRSMRRDRIESEYFGMLWAVVLRIFIGAEKRGDSLAAKLMHKKDYVHLLENLDPWVPLDYEEVIAEGTFGKVMRVSLDETAGAAKVINLLKANTKLSWILNEVNALREVQGLTNVVQMQKVQMDSPFRIAIVMEYLEGLDGVDFVNKYEDLLDDSMLAAIFRDIIIGLNGIHSQGMIHSDLKWDNIHLGTDGRVTILDLGFAVEFGDPIISTTPSYAPPVFYAHAPIASLEFDIFQLGMMLYFYLTADSFRIKTQKDVVGMEAQVKRGMADYLKDHCSQSKLNMQEFIEMAMFQRKPLTDLLKSKFIASAATPKQLQTWLTENLTAAE